jgi:hypothetical protein
MTNHSSVPVTSPPALGRALLAFAVLLDALEELTQLPFAGPCTCKTSSKCYCQACTNEDLAHDANGMIYTVNLFENILDSQEMGGHGSPGHKLRTFLEDNKADWPDPDRIAEALLRLIGQDGDTADEPTAIVAGGSN